MLLIYEAIDKDGALIKGELDVKDKEAAASYLEGRNFIPVAIQERGVIKSEHGLSTSLFERVTALDRIFLLRNLSTMLKAGLGLVEALNILIVDTEKNVLKKVLITAKFNLEKGQPLSATFDYYKKYFTPIFIGLIRAGEISGKLTESIDELILQLSREHNLLRKVKSALAYPVILIVASIAVISSLLFFVLPKLAVSLERSGAELPLVTRIIIKMSDLATGHPFINLGLIAIIAWLIIYFKKTEIGNRYYLKIVLNVPLLKNLFKKVALVRFSRTLSSLIESGITIVEALDLCAKAIGNNAYKRAILDSIAEVQNGVSLSKTFSKKSELFPHLLVSMMAVGEKTGTLADVLKNFSVFYEEEVDNTLKDLVTFLEPILLLAMGLVIGTIAISILLPIYQLVGKFI